MLDANKIKTILKKHRRLFLGLGVAIVFGGLILITLIPRTSGPLTNLPDLTTPTPIPTPIESQLFAFPETVDLNNAQNDVRTDQAVTYITVFSSNQELDPTTIISQYQLSAQPESIDTEFIKIKTWQGSDYYLSQNLLARQISLNYKVKNQATQTNRFPANTTLTQNTVNLVRSLKVFSDQITFRLETATYFSYDHEWPEPSNAADAQYIRLILTPLINNLPIYQQELPFLAANFDRTGKLLKLEITNPLQSLSPGSSNLLATIDELKTRSPRSFFRLFVKPETSEEYFISAPDIKNVTPERLSLGYFLNNNLLEPVYLLRTDNYIYATSAIPEP